MDIENWFRRLLGLKPGVPCNLCRCNIPASDIEKGLAIVVARKQYCRGCVEEITHRTSRNAGFTLTDVGSSSSVLLG
jgi:hypothetical protein